MTLGKATREKQGRLKYSEAMIKKLVKKIRNTTC